MIWKGWNKACSNIGNAAGEAGTINLARLQLTRTSLAIERSNLIRPDKLSKVYWSKWGLLGFFEMTPRIPTRRLSIRSKMGVNEPLAVTMTLMTPNQKYRVRESSVKKS